MKFTRYSAMKSGNFMLLAAMKGPGLPRSIESDAGKASHGHRVLEVPNILTSRAPLL